MTESVEDSSRDNESEDLLLQIKNLKTYFYTEEGVVKAVDGISFDIYDNEVIGLVGETGCGKSVTALSILNLVRAPGRIIDGQIIFRDINLVKLNKKEMKQYRGNDITMIFQDPLNSLNPVMTVGTQVGETFLLHQNAMLKTEVDRRILERKQGLKELKNLKMKVKRNAKLVQGSELERDEEILSNEEVEEINLRIEQLSKET